LEGLDRRLSLRRNGLQREKSQKTGKTQKKVLNNFPDTPVFLQNGLDFPPKTALARRRRLQVADFQHLPAYENQGTPFPDFNKSNFKNGLTNFI
jgi:hypothetical protein